MNNQAFLKSSKEAKQRKLDAVLHRAAGNELTLEQRLMLRRAVGSKRQYRLLIERDPARFCRRIRLCKLRGLDVRPVFGSDRHPRAASAVLIRHAPNGMPNTACIYLPDKKKGVHHVHRKKTSAGS